MGDVYLVLEYENRLVYLPFPKLEYIDEFTCGYDDNISLCEAISEYLDLGIPREEMLDAYISENISKLNDDMQEFEKRYLAIQYKRDNYDKSDLIIKFANFIRYKMDKVSLFSGLSQVILHYKKKYRENDVLLDKDYDKIALAYLGIDYKREKECYFKLKDMGYRTKIKKLKIDSTKTSVELKEEDKNNLCWFVGMQLDDLKEYVKTQESGSYKR